MSTIKNIFQEALLAEATYATLWNPVTNSVVSDPLKALTDEGMALTQATDFLTHWSVVSQQSNTPSGFSATVFKRKDADPTGTYQVGQYIFAVRGSETFSVLPPEVDWFSADFGEVGGLGIALHQALDMYNYWQSLTNTGTYQAAQLKVDVTQTALLAASLFKLDTKLLLESSGYLVDGDIVYSGIELVNSSTLPTGTNHPPTIGSGLLSGQSPIEVIGHSLGGHLADIFGKMFSTTTSTSSVINFNAPGFDTLTVPAQRFANWFFTNLKQAQTAAGVAVTVGDYFAADSVNYDVTGDLVHLIGTTPGGSTNIFSETETTDLLGAINAHKIKNITDALAVYDLFIKLNPTVTLAQLKPIFEQSSNVMNRSLESLVIDLGRYILGSELTIITDDRESLYVAIKNLNDGISALGLMGKLTLAAPPASGSEARTDLGKFLSLYYLTPFALKPNDAGATNTLYQLHATIADQWNADRNLSAQDIADGKANFSDMYLADRAKMLGWVLKSNLADTYGRADGIDGTYIDITSGTNLSPILNPNSVQQFVFGDGSANSITGAGKNDHLYGGLGGDTISGGDGNDYIEGGADNDTLNGDAGSDSIYGGDGSDTFTGGTGTDYLYGGAGNDKYVHANGDGTDVITDTDGLGSIQIAPGNILSGGKLVKSATNYWESTDKLTHYSIYTAADGKQTLNILLQNGEKIFVNNWLNNQLGISLQNADPVTPVTPAPITGNADYLQVAPGAAVDGQGGNDVLVGAAGNETLFGGTGNDILFGNAGDDTLDGGDGNDIIDGGIGQNVIQGGIGNDVIFVGKSYDNISIHKLNNTTGIWESVANNDTNWRDLAGSWYWQHTSTPNLYYYGSSANGLSPTVEWKATDPQFGFTVSSAVDDGVGSIIYAGDGNDVVFGSAGDDYISGDAGADVITGYKGNDVIFGGSGMDTITGGDGSDVIDGGTEDDNLIGGYGEDIIYGGDGNDVLTGDLPALVGNGSTPPNDTDFSLMGNDTLDGGIGNDSIWGGGGDDYLIGGVGDDLLIGDGISTPYTYAGNDILDGGDGNDTLTGGAKDDTLIGGAGNDLLQGDSVDALNSGFGNDYLDGGAGIDTLVGGGGNDKLYGGDGDDQVFGDASDVAISNHGNDYLDGGDGNDSLDGGAGIDTLVGGAGNDTLYGGEGNDNLSGGSDTDYLEGGAGNDSLDGGQGADQIVGGDGNDTLYGGGEGVIGANGVIQGGDNLQGGAGDDIYYIGSGDYVNDTEGNNTIYVKGVANANSATMFLLPSVDPVTGAPILALQAGGLTVFIANGLTNSSLIYQFEDGTQTSQKDYVAMSLNAAVNINTVTNAAYGGTMNDTLRAITSINTTLNGAGGNDTLFGGSGNDLLDGGAGDDILIGGNGADVYKFMLGYGQDTIQNSDSDLLGVNIDSVIFDSGINLDNIQIKTNATNDLILSIIGTTDSLTIKSYFDADANTSAVVEQIQFADGTNLSLQTILQKLQQSTPGNDYILGSVGNDTLFGDAGDDFISGRAGDDTLNGGTGNDLLLGGGGYDTYVFKIGDGNDTVNNASTVSGFLDNIKFLDVASTGLRGLGVSGNSLIINYGLSDSVTILDMFKSNVAINSFQFSDGVAYSKAELLAHNIITLSANNDLFTLESASTVKADKGNDTVTGSAGNDTLFGGVGNDVLDGGAGDDILYGEGNSNNLTGGAGNDTYVLGTGIDTINNFDTTPNNMETLDLRLTKSTDAYIYRQGDNLLVSRGTSSALINNHFSADGNNQIDRFIFSDTTWTASDIASKATLSTASVMTGTAGNDTYTFDHPNDMITEGLNAGTDTVNSYWISTTLPTNVENLNLMGTFNLNGFGNALNNVIRGNSGNNLLDGAGGTDTLIGGTGNDTYVVVAADGDVVQELANEGTDTIVLYSHNSYTLIANVENLILRYDQNSADFSTFSGNALDNSIDASGVSGVFIGLHITINGGDGNDSLGGASAAYNSIYGGNGNDTLYGNSNKDSLVGGLGDDTYNISGLGENIYENVNEGIDLVKVRTVNPGGTYTLASNIENGEIVEYILGRSDSYNLNGNELGNTLTGNAASNILNGGIGNDLLVGGGGDDTYIYNVGEGQDLIDNAASDNATATDTLNLIGVKPTDAQWTRLSNDLLITMTTSAASSIRVKNYFAGVDNKIDKVKFTHIDTNTGTTVDVVWDRPTFEALVVDRTSNNSPVVLSQIVAQIATEDALFNFTIPANAFTDVDMSDVLSYSVTLANGAALPSWLSYNVTTHTLTGTPLNADVGNLSIKVTATDIVGASANQTFGLSVANTNDAPVVVSSVASQQATDSTPFSLTIPANVFQDVDVGDVLSYSITQADGSPLPSWLTFNPSTLALSGTPNSSNVGNNILLKVTATDLAGASANTNFSLVVNSIQNLNIVGTSSNDTLTGGGGNDTINGGAGADTMIGKAGNDTYFVDNTGDIVVENLNEGTDLVNVAVATAGGTYTVAANVENASLTNTVAYSITGNALDNVLTGNAAANTLNGGAGNDTLNGLAGNDTMIGGAGNDIYTIDVTTDVITENLNEGTDLVNVAVTTAGGTYTVAANVENATLTNTVAYNLTGNALNNILTGNAAANVLDGGAGADTMIGGLGNDTYVVDNVGDVVTETSTLATEIDLVQSSISYALGTNVENLTLTGTAAINATGNTLNNTLTGNTGNNILDGGIGADTMLGGTGNDTYVVDNIGDVVTESSTLATEIDTVQASISYTLGANVEKLTLTGTTAINGTGNTLANTITGNAADNVLNGLAGNDTMIGGLGNDTYTIDVLTDVITENLNEGTDLVNVAVTTAGGTYTVAANVENATLTNTVAYSITGNALDNVLTGNAAANTLNGGAGNDILDGGAGIDTLIGGDGNDTYIVDTTTDVITEAALATSGSDTVKSSVTFVLSATSNLENLILTGTTAINATGNALANYLYGNTGNNILTDTTGGNDILQGGAGTDTLNHNATTGNSLLDGGAGNDTITGGAGKDLIIGGLGNDTITTGAGFDVISFNKGDGADIINASTGADNTLSLGGAFAYSDLSLTKTGNDLILKMGATDQITLAGWYTAATNKSVINLQVIAEAVTGFTLGGTDQLRNNKIENFNFANIVAAFDAAGATANWQLTDARLTAQLLAGSDTAAIGGDLAYQYGRNSNLTGIGLIASQNVINAASFGQTAQTLNAPTTWAAETVKLGQLFEVDIEVICIVVE